MPAWAPWCSQVPTRRSQVRDAFQSSALNQVDIVQPEPTLKK